MFNLNMFSDVSSTTKKVCATGLVLALGTVLYLHKDTVYRLVIGEKKDSDSSDESGEV
tara:strand:+ start:1653 stop:1826 length:174 start_codon:yes stop_codon:yes gene_type:complete